MTKRALLIGVEKYPNFRHLRGCINDVKILKEILSTIFGLSEENLWILTDEGPQMPTRSNILSKLEELLEVSKETDVAFIHFSGHGSQKINPTKPSNRIESIVPYDSGRHRLESRDILDFELRSYIQRLTTKTSNVFFNFDCCHSGNISRGADDTSRWVEPDMSDPGFEPSGRLSSNPAGQRSVSNIGAELCSIFAACQPDELASEKSHPYMDGQVCGAWTASIFKAVIQLSGTDITYGNLFDVAKCYCSGLSPFQHPVFEGNGKKAFLRASGVSKEMQAVRVLEVIDKDRVKISAGVIHGVETGMEFGITAAENGGDPTEVLQVHAVGLDHSLARLDLRREQTNVVVGVQCSEISRPTNQFKLRITISSNLAVEDRTVTDHLQTLSLHLRGASNKFEFVDSPSPCDMESLWEIIILDCSSTESQKPSCLYQVIPSNPSYYLITPEKELETKGILVNRDGTEEMIKKLDLVYRYHRCRSIANNMPNNKLLGKVQVKLLVKKDGQASWTQLDSVNAKEGDCLGIEVINDSTFDIHVGVLGLAEDGSVNLLSHGDDQVAPGKSIIFGDDWGPTEVVSSDPFPKETFKVFASTSFADLHILESSIGYRGDLSTLEPGSLQEMLVSMAGSSERKITKREESSVPWVTVENTVTLQRADPLKQLLLEYLNNKRFEKMSAEVFIQQLEDHCSNVPDEDYPLQLMVWELVNDHVSPKFIYQQVGEALQCGTSIDSGLFTSLMISFLQVLIQPLEAIGLSHELAVCHCKLAELLSSSLRGDRFLCTMGSIHEETSTVLLGVLQEAKAHLITVLEMVSLQHETGIFTDAQYHLGIVNSQLANVSSDEDTKEKLRLESIRAFQRSLAGCNAMKDTAGKLTCLQKILIVEDQKKANTSPEQVSLSQEVFSLLELTTEELLSEDLDEHAVMELVDLAETLLKCLKDSDLPWQENILWMVSKLESSQVWKKIEETTNEWSLKLHQVLCETYGERLIGSIQQNLWKCSEHAEIAIRGYLTLEKPNDFALQVLKYSNYLESLMEVDDVRFSSRLGMLHGNVLTWLSDIKDGPEYDETLQGLAIYHHAVLSSDTSPYKLKQILLSLPEKEKDLVKGRAFSHMGKLSLLQSADFGDAVQQPQYNWIPFSTYRISDLLNVVCKKYCCHTFATDQYFKMAEENLTKLVFLRIKNLAVHAKYTALDCRSPLLDRLRKAFEMLMIAEGLSVYHIPVYSLEAQVSAIATLEGPIWEELMDIEIEALQINEIQDISQLRLRDPVRKARDQDFARLLMCLERAKARNISVVIGGRGAGAGPISRLMTSSDLAQFGGSFTSDFLLGSQILSDRIGKNLDMVSVSWPNSTITTIGDFSPRTDAPTVQWWMSNLKNYMVCVAYCYHTHEVFMVWNHPTKILKILQGGNWVAAASALHYDRMAEFLEKKCHGSKRLFLVPHGSLHGVPLHLFPMANGQILLDLFPAGITFLPTTSLLGYLENPLKCQTNPCNVLLLQADPRGDLPFTQQEVREIFNVISSAEAEEFAVEFCPNVQLAEFKDKIKETATKAKQNEQPAILHIACHGYWDSTESSKSYLLLGKNEKCMLVDLRGLDLSHCKLVVLSACSTGLRDSATAGWTDIYAGFGAQLLANGCRNVILTLAPISDQKTSVVMTEFYTNYLCRKLSISKSLRDALLKGESNEPSPGESMPLKEDEVRLTKKKRDSNFASQRNLLQFVHIGTD